MKVRINGRMVKRNGEDVWIPAYASVLVRTQGMKSVHLKGGDAVADIPECDTLKKMLAEGKLVAADAPVKVEAPKAPKAKKGGPAVDED